ncbi:uncharacterized protein LOC131940416 [Physella acuta]|uniref:uncharacterized protein LOC131940416 n=1 Tax=Physella acuta TaxID=109671 RepID=UPI0027DD1251|nr:uncharacterized protein LOC131940416 [Physella acuta]
MTSIAIIALMLVLVAPSFQQPRGDYRGGDGNHHGNGGGPVGGGHRDGDGRRGGNRGNCGYLAPNCRANPGDYNAVFRYTYDRKSLVCNKVSVINSCAFNYGPGSNVFETLLDCSQACEYNNNNNHRGY